jgi:hypothetical protein
VRETLGKIGKDAPGLFQPVGLRLARRSFQAGSAGPFSVGSELRI